MSFQKSSLFLFLALLFSPQAFAADISYQNDTVVDLSNPDTNLTIISGSTASEIDINAGTVAVTLESGDVFTITSSEYHLEPAGILVFDRYCVGDTEYLTLRETGTSTVSLETKQCPNLLTDQGNIAGGSFAYLSKHNKKSEQNSEESKNNDQIYSDIAGHFAEEAIEEIWGTGALDNENYKEFRPDQPITRAETIKIALHVFDYQLTQDHSSLSSYLGVDQNAWYAPYLATALQQGIIQGYEDKTLRPNSFTSRTEALKIILLAAKKKITSGTASSFTDLPENFWGKDLINFAYNEKIIQGKSPKIFAPLDPVTRAELVVMARNTLK